MEALRINGPNQKPSALVYLRISNHLKISPKQHQKHIMNNKMYFFPPSSGIAACAGTVGTVATYT